MFDKDYLVISVEIPIPSDIRTFCTVSGIDMYQYTKELISMGCINHIQSNHSILLNFYNSNPKTFISLFNEKES